MADIHAPLARATARRKRAERQFARRIVGQGRRAYRASPTVRAVTNTAVGAAGADPRVVARAAYGRRYRAHQAAVARRQTQIKQAKRAQHMKRSAALHRRRYVEAKAIRRQRVQERQFARRAVRGGARAVRTSPAVRRAVRATVGPQTAHQIERTARFVATPQSRQQVRHFERRVRPAEVKQTRQMALTRERARAQRSAAERALREAQREHDTMTAPFRWLHDRPETLEEGLSHRAKKQAAGRYYREHGVAQTGGGSAAGALAKPTTTSAPARTILDYALRPAYVSAASALSTAKGETGPQRRARAMRALRGEEKPLYSDVIREAGVKNPAALAVGGFVGDVLLDPVTYLTGGRSVPVKAAARRAGQKAGRPVGQAARQEAVRGGASRREARRAGAEAAAQTAKRTRKEFKRDPRNAERLGANRGLSIGIIGVGRTSGRTTARVGRALRVPQASARVRRGRVVQTVVPHISPGFRLEGVTERQQKKANRALRRRRQGHAQSARMATNEAVALRRSLDPRLDDEIREAVEAGDLSRLSPEARQAAEWMTKKLDEIGQAEEAKGVGSRLRVQPEAPAPRANMASARQALREAQQAHEKTVAGLRGAVRRGDQAEATRLADRIPETAANVRSAGKGYAQQRRLAKEDKAALTAHRRQWGSKPPPTDQPKAYFPRPLKQETAGKAPKEPQMYSESMGRRAARAVVPGMGGGAKGRRFSHKQRSERRLWADIRKDPEALARYEADAAVVYGIRKAESGRKLADADFYDSLARSGEKLDRKTDWDTKTHSVFKVTPQGAKQITDDAEIAAAREGRKQGRYVVLPRAHVERVEQRFTGGSDRRSELGRVFDRYVTGAIKTGLTVPNPQYHLTNAYGDAWNAYLAGSLTPRGVVRATQAARQMYRQERAARRLDSSAKPVRGALRWGNERVDYDEAVERARASGAIGTGYFGRDLDEQLVLHQGQLRQNVGASRKGLGRLPSRAGARVARTKGVGSAVRTVAHPIESIRNVAQYREDANRFMTFSRAKQRGMSDDAASEYANRYHFDYGDLTPTERSLLRRLFPFYTFTARNTPVQARALIEQPGKIAAFEKLRQESANAMGLPDNWEDQLDDYEQRGLPIPIPASWGKTGDPMLLYAKLPLNDIGRLTKDPREQYRYMMAMLNPIARWPVEYFGNYNFFFEEPIDEQQKKSSGTVTKYRPAPEALIDRLPKSLRNWMVGRKYLLPPDKGPVDRRTGKRSWGWSSHNDYLAKQMPFGAVATQMGTSAANRAGQGRSERAFSYLTGLRVAPLAGADKEIGRLYREKDALEAQRTDLSQRQAGGAEGARTPEYQAVSRRITELDHRIYELSRRRGDKTPLGQQGPPRTPREAVEREIEEFKVQRSDPRAEVQREIEKFKRERGR